MVTDATEILVMESTAVDIEVLEDIADAVHALWIEGQLATHAALAQAVQFRKFEEALRGTIRQRKLDAGIEASA